jgi:hypothetical protein
MYQQDSVWQNISKGLCLTQCLSRTLFAKMYQQDSVCQNVSTGLCLPKCIDRNLSGYMYQQDTVCQNVSTGLCLPKCINRTLFAKMYQQDTLCQNVSTGLCLPKCIYRTLSTVLCLATCTNTCIKLEAILEHVSTELCLQATCINSTLSCNVYQHGNMYSTGYYLAPYINRTFSGNMYK